jgi:hypothetical protein
MVNTVFTEEDKRNLKVIALEPHEIRKLVEDLAETVVNLSDKKLLESFQAPKNDFNENKVLNYKETLEKQIGKAEKEIHS